MNNYNKLKINKQTKTKLYLCEQQNTNTNKTWQKLYKSINYNLNNKTKKKQQKQTKYIFNNTNKI